MQITCQTSPPRKHVIIGGGITALNLAFQLQRRYSHRIQITLIEKAALGGYLQTDCYGDFLFERGPHSCRTSGGGAHVLELLETLGMQEQLLHAHNAHHRYLYMHRTLFALPRQPIKWLFSPLMRSSLPGLLTEWSARSCTQEESVHAWTLRRLGQKTAEHLIDPMMRGIFAGDSKQLSMQACFPELVAKERSYGSLTRALLFSPFQGKAPGRLYSPWVQSQRSHGIFTLQGGWKQLVEALTARLASTVILCAQSEVLALEPMEGKEKIRIIMAGKPIEADVVHLTTPAHTAARLLKMSAPQAAFHLDQIPFNGVLIAHVGFKCACLPYKGFGYLIPTWEDRELLGVVWDSSIFPQQNQHPDHTRLTIMLHPDTVDPEQKVYEALKVHLKITTKPDVLQFHLLKNAIAQYTLGHIERVQNAKAALAQTMPNLHLLGSSYDGISLPACVTAAHQAVWE